MLEQSARPHKNRWRFAALALIAVLALASYWTIRLGVADQLSRSKSLSSLQRAVRLAPANAQYYAALAEYQEAEGVDPDPALAAALQLNPRDSSLWIRRGLHAEFQGHPDAAEKYLLEATRVDRQFDPRAALANFYFRRNSPEPFWHWMREALAIGYGDLTALFRLCWRMSGDAELIRARAIPPIPAALCAYLDFLLKENRLDAAAPIAAEQALTCPVLLDFVDRALAANSVLQAAVTVWNKLSARKVVVGSLTNGDFQTAPTSHGFDWSMPATPDISAVRISPRGLRIDLSGKQPEHCELLSQFVALPANSSCSLHFSFRTSDFPAQSGLQWRVLDAESPQLSSVDWKEAGMKFSTQAAVVARLALEYKRNQGTSRLEGSITLRDMRLTCK